jgi:hypothetical protein
MGTADTHTGKRALPPIDLARPTDTQVATFALG